MYIVTYFKNHQQYFSDIFLRVGLFFIHKQKTTGKTAGGRPNLNAYYN